MSVTTIYSTISTRFCCPECAGDVALQNTPGGEPAYHCLNVRCQKVIMLEAMDALALKPEPPTTPAARKAAYQLAQGVRLVAHAGGYLVPSGTRAGLVHFVSDAGNCTCEAGQKGRACWHVAAVLPMRRAA